MTTDAPTLDPLETVDDLPWQVVPVLRPQPKVELEYAAFRDRHGVCRVVTDPSDPSTWLEYQSTDLEQAKGIARMINAALRRERAANAK